MSEPQAQVHARLLSPLAAHDHLGSFPAVYLPFGASKMLGKDSTSHGLLQEAVLVVLLLFTAFFAFTARTGVSPAGRVHGILKPGDEGITSDASRNASEHAMGPTPGCLLTWTDEGDRIIKTEIERLQHPASCEDRQFLAVRMDVSGLLWNFQSFVRALALGLQLNRTVIPVARLAGGPHWQYATFDGCEPELHLGCFFPNVTTCSPPVGVGMHDIAEEELVQWNFTNQADHLESTLKELESTKVLHLSPLNGGYSGWGPDIYPKDLWISITEQPCKFFLDCNQEYFEELVNSQAPIFMLHAIISKWLFDETSRSSLLDKQLVEANPQMKHPVAAVHIRRTDKRREDPYWTKHGHQYRSVQDYYLAIDTHGRENNVSWGSVFLMTDSAHALEEFTALASVGGVPVLYNTQVNRSVMERVGGHAYIPSDVKREMQLQFLSTVSVVRKVADFAVGTISSNVFRVLLQLMGAEKQCCQVGPSGKMVQSLELEDGWSG